MTQYSALLCITLTAMLQSDAIAQAFVFQRSDSAVWAHGSCEGMLGEADNVEDLDSQEDGTASALIGLELNDGYNEISQVATGQSSLNADNQAIIQVLAVAKSIGDVNLPSLGRAGAITHSEAFGFAEAELVQMNGTGGSVNATLVIDAQVFSSFQTNAFYYSPTSVPGLQVTCSAGGSSFTIQSDISGDVWLTTTSGSTLIGSITTGVFYHESPLTLTDGDTVQISGKATTYAGGYTTTGALWDNADVESDISVSLRAIP